MKQKFYSLVVLFSLYFINQASAQALISGTFPGSSQSLLGTQYRNVRITNSSYNDAVYNGIPDLSSNRNNSRVKDEFIYSNTGSFTFTLTYDPALNRYTTSTTANSLTRAISLSNVSGRLTTDGKTALATSINLMTLAVSTENSASSIIVSNLTIDGMPVTGLYGRTRNDGESFWYFPSPSLANGFVITGTVTLSGNFANSPDGQRIEFGFANTTGAAATLPVVWGGFTSRRVNTSTNTLQWRTMQEQNTSHYNVQRSVDGINFQTIGLVLAQGTASAANDYSFEDKNAIGSIYYYRLEQVDLDSKINYSSIVKQSNGGKQTVVAGLGSNTINIQFFSNDKRSIRIVNNSGIILKQFNSTTQQQTLDVNNLSVGVYALQIINSDGTSEVHRFVK